MKIVLLLLLITAVVSGRRLSTFTLRNLAKIRGGGGFLDDKQLASLFVAQGTANSVVGLASPGKLTRLYGGEPPAAGSAAEAGWGYIASTNAAVGAMLYLRIFTDTGVAKIAAAGALPCAWMTWKLWLDGTFKSAGFHEGVGPALLLSFLPIVPLLSGTDKTDLIIKYFTAVTFSSGLLGMFGSNGMIESAFGMKITDGPTKTSFKWMGRWNFMCSIMFWSLVNDIDAFKVLGYLCLTYVAMIIDFTYINKDREEGFPNQSDLVPPFFIILNAAIALGLLVK